eukprot:2626178-Pleurochrysis_carterae.AAC.3
MCGCTRACVCVRALARACVRLCVRALVRARARSRVRVLVRACVRARARVRARAYTRAYTRARASVRAFRRRVRENVPHTHRLRLREDELDQLGLVEQRPPRVFRQPLELGHRVTFARRHGLGGGEDERVEMAEQLSLAAILLCAVRCGQS